MRSAGQNGATSIAETGCYSYGIARTLGEKMAIANVPLLAATGYDAWAIVLEQEAALGKAEGRIFPHCGRSANTAFRRQRVNLKISDLHFHDLRHEGTSRLFEAGFSIEQVALVTGHKDWKMLRRYTH